MSTDALVATAQELLRDGKTAEAIAFCRQALSADPDCLAAHVCMARATLPGEDYLSYLRRFHEALRPRVYMEIGVDAGRTLSLARPPTLSIGVDPVQKEAPVFAAETRLFSMESDAFFGSGQAARELAGSAIELAFIDGLHLFEQALRDFIHVEAAAAPGSVVLFHDCLPLDAATSTRTRSTGFWSGDVWKIVPILTRFRPDLKVFVIATYPTGLGVVTRLDPASRILPQRFEEIVSAFTPQVWSAAPGSSPLPVVANDWPAVLARVRGPA